MSDYLPSQYNLPAISKGDTFPGLTVDSITVNGSQPTSALASVRMDFRTSPDAATAALSINSATSAITISDNAAYTFTIEAFDVTLDPDTYYYDIETTDSGSTPTIRTYLKGVWKVVQDVTR